MSEIVIQRNEQNEMVEIIKLMSNGDIYIRGKLVTNDIEVVEGMRQLCIDAGYIKLRDQVKK